MSRHFLLSLAACGLVCWLLWGPMRALLFGGSAFSRGASGEWVGTMQITEGYPPPHQPEASEGTAAVPRQAAMYVHLPVSDSFLHEYSGPGELHVVGDAAALPLRLGSFRMNSPGERGKGAFISEGFLDTTVHGTFRPGQIQLENSAMGTRNDGVSFTAELHPGSKSDYQKLFESIASRSH